ncbi:MAG: hypothetical protein ACLR2G_07340 [Phascolarctobacterium faecium]
MFGLYRMIIRICGRWFWHETYPEDFHPLRKCVDIDADVRGERKYEMAVSHGDGCSKYLSVLFMQVLLNRGIFDSARLVKLFCS